MILLCHWDTRAMRTEMRHEYKDEDSWIVYIQLSSSLTERERKREREREKGEREGGRERDRERDRGYQALSSIHFKELGGLISALPGNRRLSTICTLLRPLSISFSLSLSLSLSIATAYNVSSSITYADSVSLRLPEDASIEITRRSRSHFQFF